MHDLLKNWRHGKTDWIGPVFAHAPLLLLTVDKQLNIIDASRHLLEEFGYEMKDLAGRQLTAFIGESNDTIWPQLVVPSIKNEYQVNDARTEFCTSTGERVPVLFSAASTRKSGEHDAAAIIALSIRTLSTFSSGETSKSATDFFRTVNHELRTPMNAIMGMNALLMASPLDEQQRELSRKIQSASEAMMLLIDSLADEQSSTGNSVELHPNEFNLRAFIDTVTNHWLPIAMDKGLTFGLRYEVGLPVKIRSDGKRLAQVINSLIGNAIMRTTAGSVTLQVFPVDAVGTASHVAFDVKDTNNEDSRISVDDLAACRDLCLRLGGTLETGSDMKNNGLHTITVPTGITPANSNSTGLDNTRVSDETGDFSGCKVLVVEDNPLNQALLKSILQSIGINCHVADSGEQAIIQCEQNEYDLIFMDIQMPGMNGITTAKTIRSKLPKYEYCPIIAVTANALKNAKEDYLREGMDGYIAKPYSPNDIRRITAQIISNAA